MITKNEVQVFTFETNGITQCPEAFIQFDGKDICYYILSDFKPTQVDDIKQQFVTAFNLGMSFEEISRHMMLNGYEVELFEIR